MIAYNIGYRKEREKPADPSENKLTRRARPANGTINHRKNRKTANPWQPGSGRRSEKGNPADDKKTTANADSRRTRKLTGAPFRPGKTKILFQLSTECMPLFHRGARLSRQKGEYCRFLKQTQDIVFKKNFFIQYIVNKVLTRADKGVIIEPYPRLEKLQRGKGEK